MEQYFRHLKRGIDHMNMKITNEAGLIGISVFIHHEMDDPKGEELKEALEKAIIDTLDSWVL